MRITRTFHPVGHGAFYTERFHFDESDKNIVYDCGTKSRLNINNIIDNAFILQESIDLLVISHFHADHINGIPHLKQRCNIRRVLIPYMTHAMKAMFVAAIKQTTALNKTIKEELYNLILHPHIFFGDGTKIVIVNRQIDGYDNEIDLNELEGPINNTARIILNNNGNYPHWILVPHNYDSPSLQSRIAAEFQRQLNININTITLADVADSINNKNQYKRVYATVQRDINDTSLILFSGSAQNCCDGCLYLGDITIGKHPICQDVLTRYQTFFRYTGTFQIPHHGAKNGYCDDFWRAVRRLRKWLHALGVVCHNNNDNKHPNSTVLRNILSHGILVKSVTEDPVSIFVERI